MASCTSRRRRPPPRRRVPPPATGPATTTRDTSSFEISLGRAPWSGAAELGDDARDEQVGQQDGRAGQRAQLVARLAAEAHAVHHDEAGPGLPERGAHAGEGGGVL